MYCGTCNRSEVFVGVVVGDPGVVSGRLAKLLGGFVLFGVGDPGMVSGTLSRRDGVGDPGTVSGTMSKFLDAGLGAPEAPGTASGSESDASPCHHTCGCPGTPAGSNCSAYGQALAPDFAATLGPALMKLKPAFANGSIAGISLGDELCADGVPVSNLSTVAVFIKEQLAGTDVFIVTNEDATSFGCTLHGEQCHFPGSFVDYGSIPSAIDYISIDEYALRQMQHVQS